MAWFLEKCTTDCKFFTAGVKMLVVIKKSSKCYPR